MRSSTFERFSIMCSKILPTTITSSKYIRQISRCRPAITVSINLWKVAGAQDNPSGILWNWYSPLRVTEAVFGRSFFFTETCQYPELRWKDFYLMHLLLGFVPLSFSFLPGVTRGLYIVSKLSILMRLICSTVSAHMPWFKTKIARFLGSRSSTHFFIPRLHRTYRLSFL